MMQHEDDTPLATRLRARLETLTAERQKALDQAQRMLAAYDAAIGELTALLAPPAEPVAAEADARGNGLDLDAAADG